MTRRDPNGPRGAAEDPRRLALAMYQRALAAADAGAALHDALDAAPPSLERPIHILAIGKAAPVMAEHAVAWLASHGRTPAGGVVVGSDPAPAAHPSLVAATGDHPIPGAASGLAAEILGKAVARVADEHTAWVLLSGGASSLIATPISGIEMDDLAGLFGALLGSGLDIAAVNAIRKRFSAWAGGRLARALFPAVVEVFLVSDVPGDDPAVIGSGPTAPDPTSITEVRARLGALGRQGGIPRRCLTALSAPAASGAVETLAVGDPIFHSVSTRVVADNRRALHAAATYAEAFGYRPRIATELATGEARSAGTAIGTHALAADAGVALLWGGETTVALPVGAPPGGRCQELALAAARVVAGAPPGRLAILAGGTDGRDGPTDAAGALVDGTVWEAVRRLGRDPDVDLDRHRAHEALAAVGGLLPRRESTTNVMDVMFALVAPRTRGKDQG